MAKIKRQNSRLSFAGSLLCICKLPKNFCLQLRAFTKYEKLLLVIYAYLLKKTSDLELVFMRLSLCFFSSYQHMIPNFSRVEIWTKSYVPLHQWTKSFTFIL